MGNALDQVLIDNVVAVTLGGTSPPSSVSGWGSYRVTWPRHRGSWGPVESEEDGSDDGPPGR